MQCPSQQLQSYTGNNYSYMNIWKKYILQSFLFVVIDGDTSNKILALCDEEEISQSDYSCIDRILKNSH